MNIKTSDMTKIAMFSVLTALGAYIQIPIPYVPITLQVLFCMLSGIILGSRKAAFSQIIYVLMGLVGLPVFAGGTGGIQTIFKPSFGYILGFIICAYIVGKLIELSKELNFIKTLTVSVVGVAMIYFIGAIYLYLILNFYIHKPTTIYWVIRNGILIFLPADLLKCFIATIVGIKLKKVL